MLISTRLQAAIKGTILDPEINQGRCFLHQRTHNLYEVVAVGQSPDDYERFVTYRNINTGEIWTRPMAVFITPGRFVIEGT